MKQYIWIVLIVGLVIIGGLFFMYYSNKQRLELEKLQAKQKETGLLEKLGPLLAML